MDPEELDVEQLEERLTQIEDQVDRLAKAVRLVMERNDARWEALEADLTARVRKTSLETFTAMTTRAAEAETPKRSLRGIVLSIVIVALLAIGALVFRSRTSVEGATVAAAAAEAHTADRPAGSQAGSPTRAEAIDEVFAASDLTRFNLSGTSIAAGALGQLRWSRSRGVVFTASGLPAPDSNMGYQVWLITTAGPISAGVVVPDQSGRVTMVAEAMPSTPPVTGVRVTTEPLDGSAEPSSAPVLVAR